MDTDLKNFIISEITRLKEEKFRTVLIRYNNVDVAIETRWDSEQCREKAKIAVNSLMKIFPDMKSLTIEL